MSVFVVYNWKARMARAFADEATAESVFDCFSALIGEKYITMYELSRYGWDHEVFHLMCDEWVIEAHLSDEGSMRYEAGIWKEMVL